MIPDKIDLNALTDDENAVSPVIGVILMVAITVILAAVIGTFVLGLGQNIQQTAPQATLSVNADAAADEVTVSHDGGSALHSDRTRVVVETGGTSYIANAANSDVVLSVGKTATLYLNNSPDSNDTDIDWDGNGVAESNYGFDGTRDITPGDTVTVQLIDTQSQRVIYETEVTAG